MIPSLIPSLLRGDGVRALQGFFVRDDAYGLWRPGDAKGHTVRRAVTVDLLERHVAGEVRVGAHTTDRHHRARWMVIDVDKGSGTAVLDIMAVAARCGAPVAVEASKTGGRFHLWVFFAEAVPAWKARALGHGLLRTAGWGNHGIEVFPKQDTVEETDKGLGNFVWLPWCGANVAAGRTVFVDVRRDQWPPHADQIAYLSALPRVEA